MGKVVSKRLDILMMRRGRVGDGMVKAGLPKLSGWMVAGDRGVVDRPVRRHLAK